jgi:hypothetical protein
MKKEFVFMHIGPETSYAEMLVKSINLSNRDARIIQCSDDKTQTIKGVHEHYKRDIDHTKLMTARLQLFAEIKLTWPAIYLDTDMLVIDQIKPVELCENRDAVLCRRSFAKDSLFNTNQHGLKFEEYEGLTIDKVYPYVACSTVTRSSEVWETSLQILETIAAKYKIWYGDQEALKRIANHRPDYKIAEFPESEYGCLPEYAHLQNAKPKILHFKGRRKSVMSEAFQILTHKKNTARS